MANHVRHHLTIEGEGVTELLERIKGADTVFDFDRVIPMPPELQLQRSSDGELGIAAVTGDCDEYLPAWIREQGLATVDDFRAYVEREKPEAIELARQYLSNEQKYGYRSWYEWRLEHWGTYRNAEDVRVLEVAHQQAKLEFYTTWSPAIPVVVRLSELYPTALLTLDYRDDAYGCAGTTSLKAGAVTDSELESDA